MFVYFGLGSFSFICFFLLVFTYIKLLKSRRSSQEETLEKNPFILRPISLRRSSQEETLKKHPSILSIVSSGPLKVPPKVPLDLTISKQIVLEQLVGCGRFGEVWRGNWRTEKVSKFFYVDIKSRIMYNKRQFSVA